MDIQDLGAIGEFVSSIVIVFTLLLLVYEVRSAKQAAQVANAQERRRVRDAVWSMPVESPGLAEVMAKASAHAGNTALVDDARDFGLEPHEMGRFANYCTLMLVHWADWLGDDLPQRERQFVDLNIETRLANPVFLKWYDLTRTRMEQDLDPGHPMTRVFSYVDNFRASRSALAERGND